MRGEGATVAPLGIVCIFNAYYNQIIIEYIRCVLERRGPFIRCPLGYPKTRVAPAILHDDCEAQFSEGVGAIKAGTERKKNKCVKMTCSEHAEQLATIKSIQLFDA